MSEWRRFTTIQKAKRKGKKTGEESTVTGEIVVQRMSADISGKQQKYTRIGPQEYVPFEHEEMRTSKTPAKSTSGLKTKNITLVPEVFLFFPMREPRSGEHESGGGEKAFLSRRFAALSSEKKEKPLGPG